MCGVWRIDQLKLRIRLRIHSQRSLLLLIFCTLTTVAVIQFGWQGKNHIAEAAIPGAQFNRQSATHRMRGYYLTKNTYKGDAADGLDGNGDGVCAQGYHFGSLWEITDPSNLIYNTQLGHHRSDSGIGPPSFDSGWIRTGNAAYSSTLPGKGNCQLWSETFAYGTTISLVDQWANPHAQDIHVWDTAFRSCNDAARVWCVANEVGYKIYFPILMR